MAWADELKKLTQGTQKQTEPTRESLLEPKSESGIPTRKPDGSLTDYGKSLIENEQTQREASQILSTYKPPNQIEYVGGMYKNYEDYVANSYGSPMSRERFLQSQQEKMAQIAQDERNSQRQDGNGGGYTGTASNYGGSMGSMGSMGSTGSMSGYGQSSGNLLEQQRQARLNTAKTSLGATRENMLSNLSQKKSEIDPRIAQSRASAVSGTTIAQKRLADLIPFSGTMAGTQVAKGEEINTDLQNRQSALDVEREQSFKDIATQETEAERAYQQGLALSQAQAQEKYLQEQLNNARTQEERDYAAKQLADQRAYNQQLTAQEQAYEQQLTSEERAYKEAQTKSQTDREDYLTTIGQFSQNYQKEINNLLAQGVPENDYRVQYLRTARTQKLANMAEAEQNAYVQSVKDEQARQEQAFELAKWRFNNGLPATQLDSQLLGVPVGQVSPAQAIKQAELQLQRQRESRIASGATAKKEKSPVTLTDYEQALKGTFTEDDTAKTQSTKAAEFIIKNRNVLSNEIIQRLATRYNVTEQMINDRMKLSEFGLMKGL